MKLIYSDTDGEKNEDSVTSETNSPNPYPSLSFVALQLVSTVSLVLQAKVLLVWDVLLFEGNCVMLFGTALALMELYGPALVTTKDAGDAIRLLQSLVGSTFDSSQLVFTACMGYLAVIEAKLKQLREKHLLCISRHRRKMEHKVVLNKKVYKPGLSKHLQLKGRALLGISTPTDLLGIEKQPIRIYLNYVAVGHSPDRDCQEIAKRLVISSSLGSLPWLIFLVCLLVILLFILQSLVIVELYYKDWIEIFIIGGNILQALGQTADWFRRVWSVEPVKGNLRLSGYSACGQDGGVQLPHAYVEEGVSEADLVLLVTTRPTTGNTLAWAVACERDQWGRAIAGHVNVAPRHLTAEAETLLSATPINEFVMHVLGFDPHAFAHFGDERKRRCDKVSERVMDEKIGRMVTRVVLPLVVMHSRHHYVAFSGNFTGLELEDGGDVAHQFDDWLAGSHWEKRLLMNEIMTDQLDWGRNQGTEFVTSPCNVWKGAYHCNTIQFSGCTYNREAEGYCPIVTYSGDLPRWARCSYVFGLKNAKIISKFIFANSDSLCDDGWSFESFGVRVHSFSASPESQRFLLAVEKLEFRMVQDILISR
ncbi:hypothetical protein VNO80_14854 [Phaseolus coccineus]|uniref:Uncharacterized protein n=1 Tax=Phaseolus coccineus TaxID=3886 RepID=A0AAN9R2B6_PHACN